MTKKYWFLALATPDSRSSDGQSAQAFVFALPIHAAVLQDLQSSASVIQASLSASVPSNAVSSTTPNLPSRVQGWPLQGPRVTRPSQPPGKRGRKSLGMSSFSRASSLAAKGGGAK